MSLPQTPPPSVDVSVFDKFLPPVVRFIVYVAGLIASGVAIVLVAYGRADVAQVVTTVATVIVSGLGVTFNPLFGINSSQ